MSEEWPGTETGEEEITEGEMESVIENMRNQCLDLENTRVPDAKTAKLCWLKKSDGGERPISLLPTLGKVLEKVLNQRLQAMAEKMELHVSRQYCFRQNRSTVQAVSDLLKWINTEKEQGKQVLMVTLDLRNAFHRATQVEILKNCEEAE
ncbi:uncharacterized protein LOC143205563 [Rhynchophorus ferrugineus]|uniref:uncharacterized protein LOC143205563 n=1 Tax=Rhynchophorus ferrugineus TaxID=354439 RepID=UPI003FCDBE21